MSLLIAPSIADYTPYQSDESAGDMGVPGRTESEYQGLVEQVAARCRHLPDKPDETAAAVLRALWFAAAGQPRSCRAAMTGDLPLLSAAQYERLQQLISMRSQGAPLAYLTGRESFMGIELMAGPEALIPRQETEILARAMIDKSRELAGSRGRLIILDICTGCGNLALACAAHVGNCGVYGSDLSAEAVTLARRNAQTLEFDKRVQFRCGDLLKPFDSGEFLGNVDVVMCNPPYLSSAKAAHMDFEISHFEPGMAFDGGPFGVSILMRLIADAPRFLKSGSWFGLEVGLGQGPGMARALSATGIYSDVETRTDAAGAIRAVLACRR